VAAPYLPKGTSIESFLPLASDQTVDPDQFSKNMLDLMADIEKQYSENNLNLHQLNQ
jgi:hypothetical protein